MTVTEQLSALGAILAQRSVHSLFQPIVCLSRRCVIGYEALSRGPSNSALHSPMNLFAIARQAGRLTELEVTCRESACRRFSELNLEGKLFLNISPESLLEPRYPSGRTLQLLEQVGLSPSRVVIELTEQTPTDDLRLLHNALHHYRDMGFSIALDDLGAGYSSLRLWSELRPDYVKIDRHFIDGIHQDALKREFVGSILQIARASRAQVVAEGIELPEELAVLTDMGVDLVQGYLLGRPQEFPRGDIPGLPLPTVSSGTGQQSPVADLSPLLLKPPAVTRDVPTAQVLDTLRNQPWLDSVVVLDACGKPQGMVHRHALTAALARPDSRTGATLSSIGQLMTQDFLAVEQSLSPQQVSRLLTGRAQQRIEENFVITLNGRYLGLGRVIDLLRLITEQHQALSRCN
ncbi:EAL domain-containing protein [Pseudomonas capeferrum]|nr:EAL domain-containing protein [Pseudomonas capeferrum]